ncbi:hypothetical protein DY000_02015600 [Brassica cretica]|uniref:Uncharacterized protein n=1 Tax=Brassica cretica TaxID=69181 RepID=A0ABQ7D7X0_BRACR|nr:hypothetical protein DY000_02015600 [Brassica cretica]
MATRRCKEEAQPAGRSSVGAQVECVSSTLTGKLTLSELLADSAGFSWGSDQLSWTECSSVRQLDRVQTVTGPCGRPMCTDGPVGSCG